MSNFDIQWVRSEADIPPELWATCFPSPLEGRWWYKALEQSGLQGQFTFFYAVVSRSGQPVAIAPAFLMDVPARPVVPPALLPLFDALGKLVPSILHQRTFFAGSPCSDEGTVGILSGVEPYPVLLCLQRAMRDQAKKLGAPMQVWKDFPQSYDSALSQIAASEGLFRMISFPGTMAALPENKERYYTSLNGRHRYLLKKKLRRSQEAVNLNISILHHPDATSLDAIFGLFWQTYEKATTKFETLNRTFFSNIAAHPDAYFITLSEPNGDMVAFMLCFACGDHIINKFIGIDYERPKEWFLYFRLWDAAVNWALARKAKAIQSGQTGYKPKIEIGHRLVPLTNYCRHSNPVIHLIYKLFAKKVTWQTLDNDLAVYIKAHPKMAMNVPESICLPTPAY